MDKTAAFGIAKKYAEEVIKEFSPDRIILFGSYAKGNAHENSDIDIAVIFDGFQGDWFRTCTKLSSLTWDISTHIEPVFLDIRSNNSDFLKEVLDTGELIYQF